jgi:hypothetical protein
VTDSWRLKLYRAEKHFSDLKQAIGVPIGRHPYPVTEVFDPRGEYDYRIVFPEHPLDEEIPIVVGDLLFNIRSGLDHLFAALIPGEDKGRAQFPIFTNNPLEVNPVTGQYVRPPSRGAWLTQTKGVPCPALAVTAMLQPFYQARDTGISPEHHSLAVLATLQNADKHEKLTFLGPVLKKVQVEVEGVGTFGIVPGLYSGASVFTSPYKVNVKAEGEIGIPFGVRRDQGYEYPLTFDMILNFTANEVLPALEPFTGA